MIQRYLAIAKEKKKKRFGAAFTILFGQNAV